MYHSELCGFNGVLTVYGSKTGCEGKKDNQMISDPPVGIAHLLIVIVSHKEEPQGLPDWSYHYRTRRP